VVFGGYSVSKKSSASIFRIHFNLEDGGVETQQTTINTPVTATTTNPKSKI
jgi:hypothetical protein